RDHAWDRGGDPPELLVGPGLHGGGPRRRLDAVVLARAAPDLRVLPPPGMAPRRGGRRRGAPHHARGRPRAGGGGDHRASHPLEHARGAAAGVHDDARAKGLAGPSIVLHHGLPNALIPIVTIFGLQFGSLLAGTV